MSGGSHNYVYSTIKEELVGPMHDRELDDLMQDIADLAHDLEWADSGDYSPERYKKAVEQFKSKWFSMPRAERLRNYIDNRLAAIQSELFELIEPTDKRIKKEDEAEKAPQVSMFARAVITAYTGITMLQGDQLDKYYQYLNHYNDWFSIILYRRCKSILLVI